MPCHTSTAGVEPTITQGEYPCKQRTGVIPSCCTDEAIERGGGKSFRFDGAADQQLSWSVFPDVADAVAKVARRERSNLDRVCKQRVTPFVQGPHKIRLGMDCPTSLTNEGGLPAQSFEHCSVCQKRAVLVYGKRNSWLTDPLLNLAIGYELVQLIAWCQLSGRPMTSGEIAR